MVAATAVEWSGRDVDVNTIDKELSALWGQLAGSASVVHAVRTSIFNLVVYAGTEEAAARASDQLRQLRGRRPSRAILLISERSSEQPSVDARIAVDCQPAPGSGTPLCSEEIVVTAHGRAGDHMGSVVVPLLMPELPTYLWWPGQPPFGHRAFHRLLTLADQLIVDSAQFESPGDALANLARLCKGRQGVNDFHWARLTPWREVIAQFFDGPIWLPYASSVRSVRIEVAAGGNAAPVTAGILLLLGWVCSELGWAPETTLDGVVTESTSLAVLQGERVIPIDIRARNREGGERALVTGVELVAQPRGEPPARFSVQRGGDLNQAHVTMAIHGGAEISRVVPLTAKNDIELLAGELELAGHDWLYERVVDAASGLAGREVWVPV